MNRLWLWGGVTAVFVLSVMVALLHHPEQSASVDADLPHLEDVALGGVYLAARTGPTDDQRDPFSFAPVRMEPLASDALIVEHNTVLDNVVVEGILLRKGKRIAFLRIGGKRYSAATGQLLGNGVYVEVVDHDGVVLNNNAGERRRLQLAR